jgi:hypothetical protein
MPNDEIDSTDGHFQIVVPNFTTAVPVLPASTDPAPAAAQLSSFVRLGTASTTAAGIETDPPSTYGQQLLQIALASTPITTGNLLVDEILQGNATPLFADDVREQGTSNNATGLTQTQRQSESAALLTKGGWRDHTDGNRITTTYGDKVEVIRGNYKQVVLGRQDQASNGHTYDSSGGMLQDNDLAPGQITEISWIEAGGGTWRVVETCTKGDVDTTFDGKVVERFVGGSVTTIVGKESQATATTPLASLADASTSTDPTVARMYLEWQDAQKNAYIDTTTTFEDYVTERGYGTNGVDGGPALDFAHAENGGTNPFVLEQTWASRIETYRGSAATPIPEILETTYADSIDESIYANDISETIGSGDGWVQTITQSTHAHEIKSTTHATTVVEELIVGGTIAEVVTVPLATRTFTGASIETHAGFKWENVFGAWGALRVGGAIEVFIGLGAELNFGPALELNVGLSAAFATTKIEAASFAWSNTPSDIEAGQWKVKHWIGNVGLAGLWVVQ